MNDKYEGLISLKDTANLYSVSLGTVNNWIKGSDGFPAPVPVPDSKRILLSKQEVHDYLKVLLETRRVAPLTDHTGKRSDPDNKMSEEEKVVQENRRMNRADDYQEEADCEWSKIGVEGDSNE